MYKVLMPLIIFLCAFSCEKKLKNDVAKKPELIHTIEHDFELYKPKNKTKAVLILFGGFTEVAENIKQEFNILDLARQNDIAVIFSNYNHKLWLKNEEKHKLALSLQKIFINNNLPYNKVYMGGFSSGGNICLLVSDYIVSMKQFYIDPKGVFVVDPPIDLLALYKTSRKNIINNFSETSIQESQWLIEFLETNLGKPKDSIKNYEKYSVFMSKSSYCKNLKRLKKTKIRFYTEPDTIWWKKNRKNDYKDLNAYYLKKLSEELNNNGFCNLELIETKNKGYRKGKRHPHSWSIVDKNNLVEWILN